MEEIVQLFIRSLEDATFTNAERKTMRQLIKDYQPDRAKRDWLRSQIFDLARTRLGRHPEFAVLDWLEDANKILLEKSVAGPSNQVYFSPGESCLQAITGFVQHAIHTLHLCVFTISDDRITHVIIAAHRRGVHVQIITDNEKLYDDGSDIRSLARAGITIRVDNTPNHMHHKFALADSKTVLTGSYNWTRSAALYNHENILATTNEPTVEAYQREFDALWEEMTPFVS